MLIYEDNLVGVDFPEKCFSQGQIDIVSKDDNVETFIQSFLVSMNFGILLMKNGGFQGLNMIYDENNLSLIPRKEGDEINFMYPPMQKDNNWFESLKKELTYEEETIIEEPKKEKKVEPKKDDLDELNKLLDHFINKIP